MTKTGSVRKKRTLPFNFTPFGKLRATRFLLTAPVIATSFNKLETELIGTFFGKYDVIMPSISTGIDSKSFSQQFSLILPESSRNCRNPGGQ
jgi:hypothetical protein